LALAFAHFFQVLSLDIFFFSNRREYIYIYIYREKKKAAKKGRSLPSSSRCALSFLAHASTLSFQMFSLDIFFFSNIRHKEKHKEKNTIKKKKM